MKINEAFRSLNTMVQIGQVRLLIDGLLLNIVFFFFEKTLFHEKVRSKM